MTMLRSALVALTTTALCAGGTLAARAGEITFANGFSDPAATAALQAAVDRFEAEHPDIEVTMNTLEHEAFKLAIRNYLTTRAPDVFTWGASERLFNFVDLGLIEDVSDVWEEAGLNDTLAGTRNAVTRKGGQYAVPISGTAWGLYYRKDVLAEAGLDYPETFDELIAACLTLRENDVVPITIGTQQLWPAAAFFDALNMRINGIKFHLALLAGEETFDDERVRNVMAHWREMIEAGCFPEDHAAISYQDAMPPIVSGDAAMYLMGSFITHSFPEDVRDEVGFRAFPTVDPDVPRSENVAVDTVAIPARAENKEDARTFLKFMARPDVQSELNAAMDRLPLAEGSEVPDDALTKAGFEVTSGVAGSGQFFDRDSNPELAQTAMEGFQRFMFRPDDLDAVLEDIVRTQNRLADR